MGTYKFKTSLFWKGQAEGLPSELDVHTIRGKISEGKVVAIVGRLYTRPPLLLRVGLSAEYGTYLGSRGDLSQPRLAIVLLYLQGPHVG